MKILHISNVKNQSGWSRQAGLSLLALDSAGVDVAARHINVLNNENLDLNPRVKELLVKDCQSPDIIIQNVLPSMLEKTSRAKCISYFMCESTNFWSTGWQHHLNLMDAVIVPNFYVKESCRQSGVKVPIYIVPLAIDLDNAKKDWPLHQIKQSHNDKFIFLCIAEWTTRKNIEAVLRAFHTEFSQTEPVELVIKTTPVGMSNPQQDLENKIQSVKRGLKLYSDVSRYKRENIICGFIGEADMYSLMKSADCYVTASRAEAFNMSLAESLAIGKTCVSPNHSGMDFVNEKNSFVVRSYPSPCYNALDTLPDLYSSNEEWFEVDILSLREQMRSAFEKKKFGPT